MKFEHIVTYFLVEKIGGGAQIVKRPQFETKRYFIVFEETNLA